MYVFEKKLWFERKRMWSIATDRAARITQISVSLWFLPFTCMKIPACSVFPTVSRGDAVLFGALVGSFFRNVPQKYFLKWPSRKNKFLKNIPWIIFLDHDPKFFHNVGPQHALQKWFSECSSKKFSGKVFFETFLINSLILFLKCSLKIFFRNFFFKIFGNRI